MVVDLKEARQHKRRAFEALLKLGRVFLTLDSRVPGTKMPSEHQGKAAITLLFGLDLPVEIPDLHVDNEKISVTLSFDRQAHHCVIPWDAVWYLVPQNEKQGIVFESSLPPEAEKQIWEQGGLRPLDLDEYLDGKEESSRMQESEVRDEASAKFQVIDGDRLSSSLTTEESNDEIPSPRPVLTLVKNDNTDEG